MKTKTLLAAAALAGLLSGCATSTKCSKPGKTTSCSMAAAKGAKSSCSASSGCSSKSGCPAKTGN